VVGNIQVAAALGSIAGTFLAGFVLISAFGTRRIVAGVAVTLLVLAVAARPPWLRSGVLELGAMLAAIVTIGWTSHSPCLRESNYHCIRVVDRTDVRGRPGRYVGLYLERPRRTAPEAGRALPGERHRQHPLRLPPLRAADASADVSVRRADGTTRRLASGQRSARNLRAGGREARTASAATGRTGAGGG